jgi:leader peptidase (prepilin peptidase)/N-methyltransferase
MFYGKIVLGALLLGGAGTDLARRRIPNALILVGLGAFVALAASLYCGHETAVLTGCLWAGALSFLIHLIPWLTRSMGAGDVKLALVTGLLSGWEGWLGFLGAYSLVLIIASGALLVLGKKKAQALPLAPFMAAAWFSYQFAVAFSPHL